MAMKKYAIKLMYDGQGFCGWQKQKNGVSVQAAAEDAVFRLSGEKTCVTGSGRTDAGVHALCQTASFSLNRDFDVKKLAKGLNFYLPDAVKAFEASEVPLDFCACRSARKKTYLYKIYISEFDNPLLSGRALRVQGLDFDVMQQAANLFEGEHNFRAFMSSGSSIKTTVRTVYKSELTRGNGETCMPAGVETLSFRITANGFLYNMVRKIVGAMIAAGSRKKSLEDVASSLNFLTCSKEIAPPHGLYLLNVEY